MPDEDIVALVLAAGLGTRLLPVTKAVPKEMLPLVDRPIIQYTLEEAVASGLHHAIVVTARGKDSIQYYFDDVPELDRALQGKREAQLLESLHDLMAACSVSYVRQRKQLGIAHAVQMAHHSIGNRTFVLYFPDDVIISEVPVTEQLLRVHRQYRAPVLAVTQVPRSEVSRYGIVDAEPLGGGLYRVRGLIEKPAPEDAPSDLAIVGRYVLTPAIFPAIEATKPGANGELQITDALQVLLEQQPIYAYAFQGDRYDTGNHMGYLKSAIALALQRPEFAPELRAYLKELLSSGEPVART